MDLKFKTILMKFKEEIRDWFEHYFVKNVPGKIGRITRQIYWRRKFHKCGSLSLSLGCVITVPENIIIGGKVNIMQNCCFYANDNGLLKIGDNVSINSNVILDPADDGEILIGNNVLIGPNVVIRASNHRYVGKSIPINRQGHTGGKIVIEDDVWIGANVVILPDVTIGKGTVVGAGAVVNKDIPPYALVGGVPAKVIKENCRS